MPITLTIPDSVADAIRTPETEREPALRIELALALYADQLLGFGKARELAGLGKYEFGQLLGRHRVARQYGRDDVDRDLEYAGCKQHVTHSEPCTH